MVILSWNDFYVNFYIKMEGLVFIEDYEEEDHDYDIVDCYGRDFIRRILLENRYKMKFLL